MPSDSSAERRAARAEYMREYGRRNGAEPVLGETFRCEVCEQVKPKTGKRQRWCCSQCKAEGTRLQKMEKRRAAGMGQVGATYICENCKLQYTRAYCRQMYCSACMDLSAKDGIPKYRKRQSVYQSARNKARRRAIPSVSICERMSAGIKNSLRDGKAGRSWESLVGYTVSELMAHLERQFLPGMNWGNRSDWHIDHIVPVVAFKFESPDDEAFRRCWSLPNLRPMWARDNIRKSGRRTHLL